MVILLCVLEFVALWLFVFFEWSTNKRIQQVDSDIWAIELSLREIRSHQNSHREVVAQLLNKELDSEIYTRLNKLEANNKILSKYMSEHYKLVSKKLTKKLKK